MIEVTLYTRSDCHLCHQAEEDLHSLEQVVPHRLKLVDVDSDPKLQREYGFEVPVVKCGPYTLKAPFDRQSLEITLRSAQDREKHLEQIDEDIRSGRLGVPVVWNKSDRFNYWLSRSWLTIFNVFILVYIGLPFLAPVLMKTGAERPAALIYKIYSAACHQFAFRSFFLFGEQTVYPRAAAGLVDELSYGEATGLSEEDLWTAREFVGNSALGYKIALCERDVAIYIGILMFGLLFGLFNRQFPRLPWYAWLLIGVLPIGLDGFSQLISQPPLTWLPYRESTPIFRVVTGWLFGFATAWFGYLIAEDGMRDTREFFEAKLNRVGLQRLSE
jgi:uncharacterized membrane protein/glutaredoxin